MNKIPQKYFNTKYGRESRAIVRYCLASGMNVMDITDQLTARYRTAGGKLRRHIGNMLTIVYDFASPEIALRSARMFGYALVEGLSASQSVFIDGYADGELLCWRRRFSADVEQWPYMLAPFPAGKWKNTVAPCCLRNVLTVAPEYNLYALLDKDGTLRLFVPEACPEDILADEEVFCGEPPLYFTEHTHFVSPVFKVNLAVRILSYCLEQIGYPFVRINKMVVFTCSTAELINAYDYYRSDPWKDVDIIMRKSMTGEYVFNDARSFADSSEHAASPKNQLFASLMYALSATGILFTAAMNDGLTDLNPIVLDALCRQYNIFRK